MDAFTYNILLNVDFYWTVIIIEEGFLKMAQKVIAVLSLMQPIGSWLSFCKQK